MGFITTSGSARFVDVINGQLRIREGNDYAYHGGYRGRITGVRTRENIYQNQRSVRLEIRMESDNESPVIISATLVNADGSITTFGRMILARIGNPENKDIRDREVDITVYPFAENDKVSCASLHLAGKQAHLPALPLPSKDEPQKLRAVVDDLLNYSIAVFGTFGRSDDEQLEEPTHDVGPAISTDNQLPF